MTQTGDGKLRFIATHGEAVDALILKIGNTMTHIKFDRGPTQMMIDWFALAPTHHGALSIDHNASQFKKVAALLEIDLRIVSG